jgi:stearoyl-CoA desaturase (Delta-9 desaturase)
MLTMAEARKLQLAWSTVIPYILVHVFCLGVIFTGLQRTTAGVFAGCFLFRCFGLTICYHRYFAHRSFKTSRAMQFVLGLVGSTLLQGGVLWWAETHRRHHRNADTENDLHSPHFQGFWYSHFGWFCDVRNRMTLADKVPDLAKFPELVWLDRWPLIPFSVFALGIYWLFGLGGLLWGVFMPTVILWEITHWVQSFSHAWGGYRRWDSPDQSRNHWLLGFLAMGEYHNNHHMFPSSARQGHAWWEIDLGYGCLRALAALGLVWDVKVPTDLARRMG